MPGELLRRFGWIQVRDKDRSKAKRNARPGPLPEPKHFGKGMVLTASRRPSLLIGISGSFPAFPFTMRLGHLLKQPCPWPPKILASSFQQLGAEPQANL